MAYNVIHPEDHSWEERRRSGDEEPAPHSPTCTTAAQLGESRARLWRCPPHARGRRHVEQVQEEVFVVIEGTLTVAAG